MSSGSRKIIVRVPDELLDKIEKAIESANLSRKAEPYFISSWVRAAICEKLNHLRRNKEDDDTRLTIGQNPSARLELIDE
jgi:hypothetical protein